MTGRVTFGELAAAATAHLDDAVLQAGPAGRRREVAAAARQVQEFSQGLRAVIKVLGGYLADITGPLAEISPAEISPWARAGVEARDALGHAAAFLPPASPATTGPDEPTGRQAAGGLDAAVASMRAGRDLLHTHAAAGPGHSEWAAVITSAPARRALLCQVGSWAGQAAAQGAALTLSPAPVRRGAGPARRRLNSACQWLWVLDSAIQAVHRADPVTGQDMRLLQAVPVNAIPARRVPDGTQTVPGLCQGAADSAERIRHASWLLAPQASWSRALTADSLRQSAACGTVIGHHCQILLRSLATCAAYHGNGPLRAGLLESAEACEKARDAWLQAARRWAQIATDTRGVISPAAAGAADLALWTGRLAYDDPAWTLDAGPSQAIRPPGSLAPSAGDIPGVVAAVHYSCHTLAQLAAADQEQIRLAAGAGRLLVPTRSLPATMDVPRPFAHAPRGRVDQVLMSYQDARTTSTRATMAVADVAAAVGAPSHILTAAQEAIQASSLPDSSPITVTRAEVIRRQSPDTPGPIEHALQGMGVTSHTALLRAAAIDQAGEQLIRDHQQAAAARRRRLDPTSVGRAAGTAGPASRLLAEGESRAAVNGRPAAPSCEAEAEP